MAEGSDLDLRPARALELTTTGRDVSPDDPQTSRLTEAERIRKDKLLEEGIRRWKSSASAEAKQRAREVEDLQFARALPEDQWPEELLTARRGGLINGRRIPAKPCLVISKLNAPVDQTVNEARNARLSIRVKPKGQKSSKKGAQLRQEMIRAIEVDSNAAQPRLWALQRAAICGRGWYRIVKEYANDGDFLMDLVCKAIPNQGSVYCDPFAVEPDKADAEFMFITADLPKPEYRRRFSESDLSESEETFTSIADLPVDWVTEAHYRVAEYFYVEHTERVLVEIPAELNGGTPKRGFVDELLPPELQKAIPKGIKQRKVDDRKVRWCLINAVEILEEGEWEGKTIPIIPVVGSVSNVEGEWVYKGIVSNAKDAQRSYNVGRSAQVEAVGLAPRAPWVLGAGQDRGYEDMWEQANTYAGNYLIYNPTDFDGKLLPPPQRNTVEPAIQAITLMVREADNDIKATTGRYDPSLGNLDPNARSGKALKELKQQGELGASHFLDNLASISMRREGLIYLEMLRPVYNQPGRIARLLGEEDSDEREVLLGEPFVPGEDGKPVSTSPDDPRAETYELEDGGEYACVVSVGKSSQTQRDDNQQALETLFQAVPQIAQVGADIYVEQLEGPMAERLAKRIRKLNPALADEDKNGAQPEIDPATQQKLKALEQEKQQLTQALQQTVEQLKTNQAEAQAKVQMAQQESTAKAQAAQAEAAAKLQVEMAKIAASREQAMVDADAAREKFEAELAFEREKLALQLASEEKIAMMKIEAERASALVAAEMQAQAAAVQPMTGAGA